MFVCHVCVMFVSCLNNVWVMFVRHMLHGEYLAILLGSGTVRPEARIDLKTLCNFELSRDDFFGSLTSVKYSRKKCQMNLEGPKKIISILQNAGKSKTPVNKVNKTNISPGTCNVYAPGFPLMQLGCPNGCFSGYYKNNKTDQL